MNFRCQTLVAAAASALVSSASFAQTQLTGRVVTDSGTPIAGATVTLNGVRYSVKTDSLGRFHLSGTPGSTLSLTLRADGFREEAARIEAAGGAPALAAASGAARHAGPRGSASR